ncbi:hypothetical protein OsJ_07423 [Oryza sativa Japonica Group]|uniref:Uncharacterized protein n=1 Tax=Oryza sativa subsp. japonica TaxID=39947 RepID=A3A8T1_ORYSJ|nr:hypothetical protein OsJ_07423 [Oryza sativa Japonica Group]
MSHDWNRFQFMWSESNAEYVLMPMGLPLYSQYSFAYCYDFQRLRPMLVHRQVPRFSVLLGEVKWICRLVAGNIDLNLIHINYMLGAC